MHLGFDISQTGKGKAGCGFFAHALARALVSSGQLDQISFYPSFGDLFHDSDMPEDNPYSGRGTKYLKPQTTLVDAKAFWQEEGLADRLGKPDLIQSNNFWCPPRLPETRLIYTLHDLAFLEHPEWSTESNRTGCFEGVFKASITADWIVAISNSTRDHFLEIFPFFPRDRIEVIYQCSRYLDEYAAGVKPDLLRDFATQSFWLSVGTIEPRKNQLGLAKAYAAYRKSSPNPLPLVFAGGNGWLMQSFRESLAALDILEYVIFTGYVSDEELIWLYRNCFASVYPSYFEGFGLPVLEALQYGAPTIASHSTSIPEAAGNAALFVNPFDLQEITQALLKMESDIGLRDRLKEAGPRQASRFDWTSSADQLLTLYQKVLGSPRRAL